ncbi:MAG: formylglycine-generating enzyme family protein, partial [Candidatus Rifleibacteriota bacterium]
TQSQNDLMPDIDYKKMIRVKGGMFVMGHAPKAKKRISDSVEHRVRLSDFYLGKYEVTQEFYREVMGTNPSHFKGTQLPVEFVSWFDAVKFCNKLSRKKGFKPVYKIDGSTVTWNVNTDGYRLPTEAEWEFAACGGNKTLKYTYPGGNKAESIGWFVKNSEKKTHPIGMKKSNELGFYDMGGNVYEWCWDIYGWYDTDFQIDPTGPLVAPTKEIFRVYRGGCFYSKKIRLKSKTRSCYFQDRKEEYIGFRLARSAK